MSERITAPTTPWSDILNGQIHPELRAKCLEIITGKYYGPVKNFIGVSFRINQPGDLDDLTQGFFTRFLEKDFLDRLDRERGTFRGFLRTAAYTYVLDEIDRSKRQNPGSPLTRFGSLPYTETKADENMPTPEEQFNQAWAKELIGDALTAFRADCLDHGKKHYYDVFEQQVILPDVLNRPTYAETAKKLNISEKDVSNYLDRARGRFAKMLRAMIRSTVEKDEDVEKELADLRKYFG